MIDHVLIPTDLSPTAAAAAHYGCELAKRIGARVTLLNVFAPGVVALSDAVYAPTEQELRRLARAVRGQLLLAAEELAGSGVHIDCVAIEGLPTDGIVQYAEQHHADLIVMGTHGRRGLAHALLGSVAERVLRRARCPVLTVNPACGATAAAPAAGG